MIRAAVYVRISLDRDGAGLGVARQEADCRKLCEARGWTVAEVFSDDDVSAYDRRKARPGYQDMMAAVRAGRIDAIAVYHLDRLYRQPRELEDLIDLAESGRILFAACGGDIDLGTSHGRTMARIVVAMANAASADTSRRQRRKMLELAENGKPHGGGSRPYGYKADRVTVDRHEAAVIRECVDALLTGSTSLRGLCLRLNARGDLTPKGHPWQLSVLARMLVGERLTGKRTHRGELTNAVWPAIVTEGERVQLKALLQGRRQAARGRHLLSGLLRCGVCGGTMHAAPGNHRRSYICPPKPQGRQCVSVTAEPLEEFVVKAATAIRTRPVEPVAVATVDASAERERLADLVASVAKGVFTVDEIAPTVDELRATIASKEARKADAATAAQAARVGATLRERWPRLTLVERREALAALVYRIDVRKSTTARRIFDPARVTVTFRADIADAPGSEPGSARAAWAKEYREAYGVDWLG